jgi:antitoxin component of RelBE/YafQ-DinJ toxin-antitoxin module
MVTARMPQEKKSRCNAVLDQLGTNASNAINKLYDYVLAHHALPFEGKQELSSAEKARRIALVDSIPLAAGNRFSTMTDDEIRRERLGMRDD